MILEYYKNIPNLRPAGVVTQFTEDQVKEWIKCSESYEYFIENYVYIKDIDSPTGLTLFKLRPYQKTLLDSIHNNKFIAVRFPRQSGKSTTVAAYIIWKMIFEDKYNVIIAANKSASAIEIMERAKDAYINLPYWLQAGVTSWNVFGLQLENGSKVQASSTTKDTGRGGTKNLVLADEFAFVDPNIAEAFTASIMPSITSGQNSKFVVVSTPNGMNHFYKLWTESVAKTNDFVPVEIKWTDVPGRDEKFKKQMIGALGEEKWMQEFEMSFLGSDKTLVPTAVLSSIPFIPAKTKWDEGFRYYKDPEPNKEYVLCADTGHGKGLDYSAFLIFDVSVDPYEVVAIYANNEIPEMVYPSIIEKFAKHYNNALIVCETNDLGKSVINTIYYEKEYENVLRTLIQQGKGATISYKNKSELGLRMTSTVKKKGCSNLNSLICTGKLILNDFEIIKELSNFVAKGGSYEAKTGNNDDLVMCGVMFGWLVEQEDFQQSHGINIRKMLYEKQIQQVEEEHVPFGYYSDGNDDTDFTNVHTF